MTNTKNEVNKNQQLSVDPESYFSANIDDLDVQIAEIDKLYQETYNHYMTILNNSVKKKEASKNLNIGFENVDSFVSSKPPAFLHQQMANLISIKKLKSDLIKQKFDIQKHKSNMIQKSSQMEATADAVSTTRDAILAIIGGVGKGEIKINNDEFDDDRVVDKNQTDELIAKMLEKHDDVKLDDILIIRNQKNVFIPVEIIDGKYKYLKNVNIKSLTFHKGKDGKVYRSDTKEEVPLMNF